MTRLSLGVLCSKWLSPPRRFFGVLPKQFFTLVSQSPAVFWANGCCFRKGFVEGSAKYSLHLSPKWLLLHKKFFGGFCQLCFTFTYLPVSSWGILGSKLRELLTCLTNTNPVRRKTTHHVVAFGYSLGLFQYYRWNDEMLRSHPPNFSSSKPSPWPWTRLSPCCRASATLHRIVGNLGTTIRWSCAIRGLRKTRNDHVWLEQQLNHTRYTDFFGERCI